MTLVLDRGALVALERNERAMWVRLKGAQLAADPPLTHAGVIGQVWWGRARQARLSHALGGIDVRPLDKALGCVPTVLAATVLSAPCATRPWVGTALGLWFGFSRWGRGRPPGGIPSKSSPFVVYNASPREIAIAAIIRSAGRRRG